VLLPDELFRTITWDQGKEMSGHAAFSVDTSTTSPSTAAAITG
jgi:IS30 family transposase